MGLIPQRYTPGKQALSTVSAHQERMAKADSDLGADAGANMIVSLITQGYSVIQVAEELGVEPGVVSQFIAMTEQRRVAAIEGRMCSVAETSVDALESVLTRLATTMFPTQLDVSLVSTLNKVVGDFSSRAAQRDKVNKGIGNGVVVNNVTVVRSAGDIPEMPSELNGLVEEADWEEL